ncbi:MAG: ABC transporter ATP-binding protein [Mycoplasmatales bacterium]
MIKIKNLTISYGKHKIFENFNLDIKDKCITALIAPSGTGKTTLFNAIMGIQKYSNGQIILDGEQITNKSFYSKVSFMPQEDGLYEYLTGIQNFKFFLHLNKQKMTNSEIEQLFTEFDLTNALHKKVENYSGGMKKKLSLMITLAKPAKYFFLDEPTVGIDPVQKEEFWKKLYKIANESDKTIIVTTHVMDEASKCDEIIFIRDGQVIANDTQAHILETMKVNDLNEAFIKLVNGGKKWLQLPNEFSKK